VLLEGSRQRQRKDAFNKDRPSPDEADPWQNSAHFGEPLGLLYMYKQALIME